MHEQNIVEYLNGLNSDALIKYSSEYLGQQIAANNPIAVNVGVPNVSFFEFKLFNGKNTKNNLTKKYLGHHSNIKLNLPDFYIPIGLDYHGYLCINKSNENVILYSLYDEMEYYFNSSLTSLIYCLVIVDSTIMQKSKYKSGEIELCENELILIKECARDLSNIEERVNSDTEYYWSRIIEDMKEGII